MTHPPPCAMEFEIRLVTLRRSSDSRKTQAEHLFQAWPSLMMAHPVRGKSMKPIAHSNEKASRETPWLTSRTVVQPVQNTSRSYTSYLLADPSPTEVASTTMSGQLCRILEGDGVSWNPRPLACTYIARPCRPNLCFRSYSYGGTALTVVA